MAFEFGEAAQSIAYFIKAVKCRPASPEEKSEGESFPKESPAALKGLQNKKYYWESWEVCWDRQGSGGV